MDEAIDTLRTDPDLRPPIERHDCLSIVPTDDLLARFVVSVLRQQVSMASAAATRRRLFEAVEVPPDTLDADDDTLRDAGLSRQRTRCVTNVAAAFRDRGYTLDSLAGMDDRAVVDVQNRLRLLAVVERQHADADSIVRAIRHADPFRSAAERYAGRPRPPAVSDPPDSAGVNR
jgi:endonuclease III